MRSHPRHALLAAALAAVLVTTSWPAGAARAADDSNIPGIPLPGPIVTGSLGGPIYDHVYSIDVPPARVILLSLSGDTGTDFGLYLFNSSATTVYRTAGQVASSAAPGSSQSIRYPTPVGGRFYIDLNGASNVEGTFRLVVSVAADATPPQASVSLDGGAPATNDASVRVTLAASDDLSGVAGMQFSGDGHAWTAWLPYALTSAWTFPPGDGRKQLWARVRDAAGNVSSTVTGSIVLDTTAPQVLARSPAPGTDVIGLRAPFTVTFSESIDVASWLDVGLLVQDPDGTTIRGTYTWDAATNTGRFTPNTPLIAGAAYVVTLGSIVDLAGNPLPLLGSWVVRALVGHTITLSVSPRVAGAGGRAAISGSVEGPLDAPLLLDESIGGGPWGAIAVLSTDGRGRFFASVPVFANTSFRAHFLGSPTEAETYSPVTRVLVRRSIQVVVGRSTTLRASRAGSAVPVVVTLRPPGPDVPVTLAVFTRDTGSATWRRVSGVVRRSAHGTATFSWRPMAPGMYRLLVSTAPSALFANASSSSVWLAR